MEEVKRNVGSVLRCGVGEERSGGCVKGGEGRCGERCRGK